MVTPEEMRVLRHLRRHRGSPMPAAAPPGAAGRWREWDHRVLANLEWLGLITVFCDGSGGPAVLELTDRGGALLGHSADRP